MRRATPGSPSAGGWVVLGLLIDGARSGYELAALAERSVGQFWPVTKAHVYGELPRLERLGFVKGKDVAQHGLPDKRVYAVTASGRRAFRAWLEEVDLGEPLLRHPLLLRVFFGAEGSTDKLATEMAAYRRQLVAARVHYQQLLDLQAPARGGTSRSRPASGLRGLVIRHALRRIDAEIDWLVEVEKSGWQSA